MRFRGDRKSNHHQCLGSFDLRSRLCSLADAASFIMYAHSALSIPSIRRRQTGCSTSRACSQSGAIHFRLWYFPKSHSFVPCSSTRFLVVTPSTYLPCPHLLPPCTLFLPRQYLSVDRILVALTITRDGKRSGYFTPSHVVIFPWARKFSKRKVILLIIATTRYMQIFDHLCSGAGRRRRD